MAKRTERPIRVKGPLIDAVKDGRLQAEIDRRRAAELAAKRQKHDPQKNK